MPPKSSSEGETWVSPRPGGGGMRVAVAYPNSYWVGMSNLGYQAVLRAFLERPGFAVRRVFWEGERLRFPDGGRSLGEFDVIALSASYQPDLVNLPRLLEAGGVSVAAQDRPFLLGGGIALTINPEPALPFFDAVVLGDGEPALPAILDALEAGSGRLQSIVERLDGLEGLYLPSRFPVTEDPSRSSFLIPEGRGGATAEVACLGSLDGSPARPAVLGERTEFGSMFLLEVSRGCPSGCAFCAASAVCGPVRFLGLDAFAREVEVGLRHRRRIGLVGTAVSFHPSLLQMADLVHEAGGGFSPSSVRLERMNAPLAERLARSGHRTVSLAPEAGSARLRSRMGKGYGQDALDDAVTCLQEAGIPNLKLYFMVGLPGEEPSDVDAIVEASARVRDLMVERGRGRGRVGTVTVSVNPFVPKPHTPWEREPMADEGVLERRLRQVKEGVGRLGGVKAQAGSARASILDALISLGDRSLAPLLGRLPRQGVGLSRLARMAPRAEAILFGRGQGVLPWHHVRPCARR